MRFQDVIGVALLGSSVLQHVAAIQSDGEGEIMNAEHLEPRQSTTIAVTGVTGNGVQPRLELRTMQQQYPDMFNVFLLGLRKFMQMSQSDPLSYYQIAGIVSQLLCSVHENILMFEQAFTEGHMFRGTTLVLPLDSVVATALTLRTCFCHGIDHTWLCLRFVAIISNTLISY